ncbi:flavin reductase family protein [Paenarthrobacter sp. RAF54_2]|uniref:flavin reductase family protein n=1 Tax=Paenarthrobacter sp. RAF54_2 TaxID=3233061 RepID=UPI003F97A7D4
MIATESLNSHPMSADHFKNVFREHPGGVALITADPGGAFAPAALTATSVISLSAEPPTMAFSVSEFSSSTPALRVAETAVVHLLDADSIHLAKLGATSGINRFEDSALWGRLDTGEPYFKDARIWIQAKVIGRLDVTGATILAVEGQAIGGRAFGSEQPAVPLVYCNRTWHQLGDQSVLAG